MKNIICQEVTRTCANKATFKVTTKWGAGSGDIDTFYMCKKCSMNMKKECEDWGYIWISTPMKTKKGKI